MPITAITVSDIADFAGGHEFGAVGAYLRIRGVARGVLDPDATENAGIVDLDKAPRNATGTRRVCHRHRHAAAEEHATRQRHPGL